MSHRIILVTLAGLALIGAVTAAVLVSTDTGTRDAAVQFAAGGKVRRLSGDHIKLKDGRYVEFAGIRLPYDHEPNADNARRVLAKWLENEGVRLQFDELREHRRDRILAYVYANDTFINERLVRDGLAFVKTRAGNRQHADVLLEAQNAARAEGKGIWSLVTPSNNGVFSADLAGATFHRSECDMRSKETTLVEMHGTNEAFSKGLAPCGKCRPLENGAG
jgi:endonuclease YncB( thermonuclease family)